MTLPFIGTLSVDLVIIATAVGLALFMMIFGHGKLRNFALSSYVGLVVALEFTKLVHGYLPNFSDGTIRLALYIAPIILLEFGRRHQESQRQGFVIGMVLAITTAALIVSGVLTQLDDATRTSITGSSSLAYFIYNLRLIWLGVVPFLVMLEGFVKPKDKHH